MNRVCAATAASVALVTCISAALGIVAAPPAQAHFCASPVRIEPGRQSTVSIAVAAEARALEVAIGVPRAFQVEEALDTGPWRGTVTGRTVR